MLESGECPQCEKVLYGEKDFKILPVSPDEDYVHGQLQGFTPRTILMSAFNGIQFYCDQMELVSGALLQQHSANAKKHEEAYKRKLQAGPSRAYCPDFSQPVMSDSV